MKRMPKGAPAKGCPPKGSWGMGYIIERNEYKTRKIRCYNCDWYDSSDGSCSKLPIIPHEVGHNYAYTCKEYKSSIEINAVGTSGYGYSFVDLPDYTKVIKSIDDKYFTNMYNLDFPKVFKNGLYNDENIYANIISTALSKRINIIDKLCKIKGKIDKDIRFVSDPKGHFSEYYTDDLKKSLVIMNMIIDSLGFGVDKKTIFEKNNNGRFFDIIGVLRDCRSNGYIKKLKKDYYVVHGYSCDAEKAKYLQWINIYIDGQVHSYKVIVVMDATIPNILNEKVVLYYTDKNSLYGLEIAEVCET